VRARVFYAAKAGRLNMGSVPSVIGDSFETRRGEGGGEEDMFVSYKVPRPTMVRSLLHERNLLHEENDRVGGGETAETATVDNEGEKGEDDGNEQREEETERETEKGEREKKIERPHPHPHWRSDFESMQDFNRWVQQDVEAFLVGIRKQILEERPEHLREFVLGEMVRRIEREKEEKREEEEEGDDGGTMEVEITQEVSSLLYKMDV